MRTRYSAAMMPLDLYLAYVLACVVLIVIPGPNIALIVANSVAHGARFGLLTVAGTSSSVVIHLALTVAGASVVLNFLAASFEWLRWIGVAYLVWLGVAAWRTPATDLSRVGAQARSARVIFLRGFLVGLTNPKTLLFYGAFLPQFIVPGPTASDQLLLLAATFLAIAVVLDGVWALLADRLRALLVAHVRLRNRLTGGLLIGAGVGLALARRP
ncbi:LysE family translocator [Reyranella sp.]|uniref:LysE family translocator n=1 Tax=Reyranella sp. TaxID=1929291 RepID=UPI003784E436